MKTIAALEVDFGVTPLGTRSRLEHPLHDGRGGCETVLRRTLRRLLRCKRLARIHVTVHPAAKERADAAVAGLDVAVETHDAPLPPWRVPAVTGGRTASARKWALEGWRGGIGDFCGLDEGMNIWLLEALARHAAADAIVAVPPAAPLFDPVMLDAMIEQLERIRGEMRFVFAQAPPGLVAPVYTTGMLTDLAKTGWPMGRVLAYRPDDPQRDLTIRDCCYHAGTAIEGASGRLIADTDRSLARVKSALEALGDDADAQAASTWLCGVDAWDAGPLPREVEIELTTDDQLPDTTLRPRGDRVGRRGPMAMAILEPLLAELATRDDSLVVFGGHGEPFLHPAFAEIVRHARRAGVFGIAVRTNALDLDEKGIESICDARVDVVSVLLDAHSADVYAKVHGFNGYEQAAGNVNRLLAALAARDERHVIVVPELTKTRETMGQMEAFYDDWVRKAGAAVITGPARYGGLLEDRAVVDMAPPRRFRCVRLWSRLMVLADGRVTPCDQDARGEHAVGDLARSSLGELWIGPRMTALREAHRRGSYGEMSLCPACREWHRP